jgi:leucyl-tRNA synthetase
MNACNATEKQVKAAQVSNTWPEYQPQQIEPKWHARWEQERLFAALEESEKPKFYCLDFFPYPSGEGLHVGHCRNYVPTDVLSRSYRMQGFNVLYPMGWDAFGEPAEQHAIAHGIHPRQTTDRNTTNYRRQMTLIGAGYDWEREIDSSKPEFYRWTQWFFLLLYKRGLAYRDINLQWWCPTCQTTLSSHEAVGGVCWRGHTGVTRQRIPAWYFRITAYADQLLAGLDEIEWPERIKTMQRKWIGRSEGAEVIFPVAGRPELPGLKVFTTRPDTLFGVTFFALAPEHSQLTSLTTPDRKLEVQAYVDAAARRGELERMMETSDKTGVFTGAYVTNPLSGEHIPVWVADYVLPGYGSGAVMGVPAHDTRDFEFARKYGLEIRQVIKPAQEESVITLLEQAFVDDGVMVNSGEFDGLPSRTGWQRIVVALAEKGAGKEAVSYRMRDWLISRQRYWGTPIPIVYCDSCGEQPVPQDQLPVLLPPMQDFTPDGSGRSPLARLPEFLHTACPVCGGPAERETDTMGGFACSSWYFLRFTSPQYNQGPFEPQAMRYWMPVDLYVGGAEHAVLHLLYARFWTRVLADAGLLDFHEPFSRLMNQGQMLGLDGQRMAKSRGNVITPDSVVASHGADALRLYEMFMAPFEQDIAWSTQGLQGTRRFLNRLWDLYGNTYFSSQQMTEMDAELERQLHQTVRKVSQRIAGFRFNTMVSTLMEFLNFLNDRFQAGKWQTKTFHQSLETFLLLLAPAAPHITEELWQLTGHTGSIHCQTWPTWDAELAQDELLQIAVQVNGKLRLVLRISAEAEEAEVQHAAMAEESVQRYLQGKEIRKVIFIPGRTINFVV